jgi:hypothetical protein
MVAQSLATSVILERSSDYGNGIVSEHQAVLESHA